MGETNSQLGSSFCKIKQHKKPMMIVNPKDVVFFSTVNADKKIDLKPSSPAQTDINQSARGAQQCFFQTPSQSWQNNIFPKPAARLSTTLTNSLTTESKELLTGFQTSACSFEGRASNPDWHNRCHSPQRTVNNRLRKSLKSATARSRSRNNTAPVSKRESIVMSGGELDLSPELKTAFLNTQQNSCSNSMVFQQLAL